MICIKAEIPKELSLIDDELKAIYHSTDTVCFFIFKTRQERNDFMERTKGMQKTEREEYTRLTDDEFNDLVANPEVKVKNHSEYEEPITDDQGKELDKVTLHDVVIHRTRLYGQVKIEPVPPEEFLISRRSKDINSANFVCHRTNKTRTELVEMGYDKDLVDGLPTGDTDFFTEEKFVRHQNIDFSHGASEGDKSTNDILIYECYIRMDVNEDGKSELLKKILDKGFSFNEALIYPHFLNELFLRRLLLFQITTHHLRQTSPKLVPGQHQT